MLGCVMKGPYENIQSSLAHSLETAFNFVAKTKGAPRNSLPEEQQREGESITKTVATAREKLFERMINSYPVECCEQLVETFKQHPKTSVRSDEDKQYAALMGNLEVLLQEMDSHRKRTSGKSSKELSKAEQLEFETLSDKFWKLRQELKDHLTKHPDSLLFVLPPEQAAKIRQINETKPSPPPFLMSKKRLIIASTDGNIDKTNLETTLSDLSKQGLITKYEIQDKSFKVTTKENKQLEFDLVNRRITSNDTSQESYDASARVAHELGCGFDMKELVQMKGSEAEACLYRAYAAGKKLEAEGFKFANLPKDIEQKLEEKYLQEQPAGLRPS